MSLTTARHALDRLCAGVAAEDPEPAGRVVVGSARIDVFGSIDDPRTTGLLRGLRTGPLDTGEPNAIVHVGPVTQRELLGWANLPDSTPVVRMVDPAHGLLGVWDRERRIGFWGVRDAGAPSWDVGAPMRPVLAWILEDEGALVHAAVVVGTAGAILLAGPGGSGKSTTALHAVLHGYGTLGDDYCLVDQRTRTAERIFATSKVREAERAALEQLVGPPFGRCEEPDDRTIHTLPRALDRAPLTALVLPRLEGARNATLQPCSRGLALRTLAPSSIDQLPVARGPMLARITELLRGLPTHTLDLSPDRAANIAALAPLLGDPLDDASVLPERR